MTSEEHIEAMAEARAIAGGAAISPQRQHVQAMLSAIDALNTANRELQETVRFIARWSWDETGNEGRDNNG